MAVSSIYGLVAPANSNDIHADDKYFGVDWSDRLKDEKVPKNLRPALGALETFIYAGFRQAEPSDQEKEALWSVIDTWIKSPSFSQQDFDKIKETLAGFTRPEFAPRAREAMTVLEDIKYLDKNPSSKAGKALEVHKLSEIDISQPRSIPNKPVNTPTPSAGANAASSSPAAAQSPDPGSKVDVPKKDDKADEPKKYEFLDGRRRLLKSVGFSTRFAATGEGGQKFVQYAPGLGKKALGKEFLAPNEPGRINPIYHEVGEKGSGPYFSKLDFIFKGDIPLGVGVYGSGPVNQVSNVSAWVSNGGASQDFSVSRVGGFISVPKPGIAMGDVASTKKGRSFRWGVRLFGGDFGLGMGNFHCEQLGERTCPTNGFEFMVFNVREQLNVSFGWKAKSGLPISISAGIGVFSTNFYIKRHIYQELEMPSVNIWPVQYSIGMMFGGSVADKPKPADFLYHEGKGAAAEGAHVLADLVVTPVSTGALTEELDAVADGRLNGNDPVQPSTLSSTTALQRFNNLLIGASFGLITALPDVLHEGKTADRILVGGAYAAGVGVAIGKWALHRDEDTRGYAGRLLVYNYGILGALTLSDYLERKLGATDAAISAPVHGKPSFKAKVPWLLVGAKLSAGTLMTVFGLIHSGVDPILPGDAGQADRDQLVNDPKSSRFGDRYSFISDALLGGGISVLLNGAFTGVNLARRRSGYIKSQVPGGSSLEVNPKDIKKTVSGGVNFTNPPPVNGQKARGLMINATLRF